MSNLQPRFLSKARNPFEKSSPKKVSAAQSGFDIQLCGFGKMSVYHGVNECPPRGENLRVWHGFSTFGGTDGVSPWGIAVGEKPTERYCTLSEMAKAYEVMTRLVCLLEPLEKWKGWKGWGPFVSPSL